MYIINIQCGEIWGDLAGLFQPCFSPVSALFHTCFSPVCTSNQSIIVISNTTFNISMCFYFIILQYTVCHVLKKKLKANQMMRICCVYLSHCRFLKSTMLISASTLPVPPPPKQVRTMALIFNMLFFQVNSVNLRKSKAFYYNP